LAEALADAIVRPVEADHFADNLLQIQQVFYNPSFLIVDEMSCFHRSIWFPYLISKPLGPVRSLLTTHIYLGTAEKHLSATLRGNYCRKLCEILVP
jgi:hypothetical protein